MDFINFFVVLATGIIPLVIGSIWYSPMLFAQSWMKESNMTEDMIKTGNMVKIFGLTLVLGVFLAMGLMPIVIHQMGVFSTLEGSDVMVPGSQAHTLFNEIMDNYGNEFRTFKHGALHGGLTGLFIFLPLIGINGLFERKSFKYIMIHVGYWTVCSIIMGGIISAFA